MTCYQSYYMCYDVHICKAHAEVYGQFYTNINMIQGKNRTHACTVINESNNYVCDSGTIAINP